MTSKLSDELNLELLTDAARKTLEVASREAHRLNHEYIGTEHLLLAILLERDVNAISLLARLEVDPIRLAATTEQLIRPGDEPTNMSLLPKTPRTKNAIKLAIKWAQNMGHKGVSTSHLLLGLVEEQEGIAATAMGMFGVSLERAVRVFPGAPVEGADRLGQGVYCLKASPLMTWDIASHQSLIDQLVRMSYFMDISSILVIGQERMKQEGV